MASYVFVSTGVAGYNAPEPADGKDWVLPFDYESGSADQYSPLAVSRYDRDKLCFRLKELDLSYSSTTALGGFSFDIVGMMRSDENGDELTDENDFRAPGVDLTFGQSSYEAGPFHWFGSFDQDPGPPIISADFQLRLGAKRLLDGTTVPHMKYDTGTGLWVPSIFIDLTITVDNGTEFQQSVTSYVPAAPPSPDFTFDSDFDDFGQIETFIRTDVAAQPVTAASLTLTAVGYYTWNGKWDEETGD